MAVHDLPTRQLRALAYLAEAGRATAKEVTAALRADRADVSNALRLLASKGLATADLSTWPTSYVITDEGREALAAMTEGGEA